jgi:hypothetical protein
MVRWGAPSCSGLLRLRVNATQPPGLFYHEELETLEDNEGQPMPPAIFVGENYEGRKVVTFAGIKVEEEYLLLDDRPHVSVRFPHERIRLG